MPNLIDRAIGWIDPMRGLARHFARQRLSRAYEAASPRDQWKPRRPGASANADHRADAGALRSKARFLCQNVPYIASGMDALVGATIGTGIIPRATGKEADKLNTLFAQWAQVCDADGRLDYYGLQAAAYRAMEQDGEVLLRLRPRLPTDGLPVPLQLQLLEIDWLDSTKFGSSGNNVIINGIEYDLLGRVAAYWLWNNHPGDIGPFTAPRSLFSTRVPAASIIHLYRAERPGQGRGFTRLASIIARVRDLQLYEDAELARKNLEARLSVLASGDVATMANPAMGADFADPAKAANSGDLGDLPSGSITSLPPGTNVTVVEPKPAVGYVEYVKQQLHVIAAGMGVTYEALTGDLSEVNFSSARVRLLDFRRNVQQIQWLYIVPKLLTPIHQAFINAAFLAGKVKAIDYAVKFSTPKWDYVNPSQEVDADMKEISAGLTSISEKLRMRGYEPEQVFQELADDINRLQALGILDTMLFMQKGFSPSPQPDGGAAPAPAPAPKAKTAAKN